MDKILELALDLMAGGNFLLAIGIFALLGFFNWNRIREQWTQFQEDKISAFLTPWHVSILNPRLRACSEKNLPNGIASWP